MAEGDGLVRRGQNIGARHYHPGGNAHKKE
jgi:hypothetical protein